MLLFLAKKYGNLNCKRKRIRKKYELYSGLSKEEIIKKNMPFYVVSIALLLAIITVIFFLVKFIKNKINKKIKIKINTGIKISILFTS